MIFFSFFSFFLFCCFSPSIPMRSEEPTAKVARSRRRSVAAWCCMRWWRRVGVRRWCQTVTWRRARQATVVQPRAQWARWRRAKRRTAAAQRVRPGWRARRCRWLQLANDGGGRRHRSDTWKGASSFLKPEQRLQTS
jgi:hypothetical protein